MNVPMTSEAFIERYGSLFEHSPWVVERAGQRQPFDDLDAGLMAVVAEATPDEQLALIRAHPELAGKAAIDKTLTAASTSEQASAGLDRLTPEEYDRFHVLNSAYSARFGFPFVICVRNTGKVGILDAIQTRLSHTPDQERSTALSEIGEIVRLRLADLEAAS